MRQNAKILFAILPLATFAASAFAVTAPDLPAADDFIPASQLLNRTPDDTKCATAVFANALIEYNENISATTSELEIRQWIHKTFARPDVLQRAIACPEIANAADDDTIKFLPIEYQFPSGRKIVVNYETQPRVLKQRISLGAKRDLPSDPNPRIGGTNDTSTWSNTDPAWYGILVVQSGTLNEFVGPTKNNTISLAYIEENIDTLYPQGTHCTSKTALTADSDIINQAVTNTVGLKETTGEDDSNDYYVAGNANLQWISYAEIALDVALTVATYGGWTAISGATKATRASKSLKGLSTTLRSLTQLDSVRDYMRMVQRHSKLTAEIKTIDRTADAAKYARTTDEIQNLEKTMQHLENADDNVKKYRDASKTFTELNAYRRTLRIGQLAKRGNIAVRLWNGIRATHTGNKTIKAANTLGRASKMSGRVRDWLFDSTLRHAGTLARAGADISLISGAVKFLGDMYDYTETSTGEFTNNIQFKPLCLLSADDLSGQENVVNYGMWLMWMGDATSAADDDAAYLQAMDFAAKFHQDLELVMEEKNSTVCDVDIFVVRPVIRNPDRADASLYYLIMNDTPWTTHVTE